MNKAINRLRLFFCTFSGEDDYIIRECRSGIQVSFALIGFFVLVVFAGCWVSASAFVKQLFEGGNKWFSIPIGILWALLVTNLYLLLLYTVSPALLPIAKKKKVKGKKRSVLFIEEKPKSSFNASLIFRLVFISLLAIIIAQPLNVLLLSGFPETEKSLDNYKTEYRINMMIIADSSLIKQEVQNQTDFYQNINSKIHVNDSIIVANNVQLLNEKVANDRDFLEKSRVLSDTLSKWNRLPFTKNIKKCGSLRTILSQLLDAEIKSDDNFIASIDNVRFTGTLLQLDFENYRASIKNTIEEKIKNYKRLNELLEKSNFYVKTIQILMSENPASWVITILVCGIFLIPIYWKFSIRNHGGFYEIKKYIENKMVHDDYNEFKNSYSLVFDKKLKQFNRQTWVTTMHLVHKMEKNNPDKFLLIRQNIKSEMTEEVVSKYEYWADPPFNCVKRESVKSFKNQQILLDKIYNTVESSEENKFFVSETITSNA